MLAFDVPAVMGILNVTPDSFSDGGKFLSAEAAAEHAGAMIDAGAAIIDIGGESTRPGAEPTPVVEQLRRVIPVIERIRAFSGICISVDTSEPEVMRAAAEKGANIINDVRALQCPGALEAAAATGLPVCLMHMRGDPGTMQRNTHYDDVMSEVTAFLEERMAQCEAAGIEREHIILDPGIGFAKTPAQNLELINRLPALCSLGRPVLVGLSRKSTIARIVGDGKDRLIGSVAGAVMAVARGASIVRAHDVGPTVEALKVARAVMQERTESSR